MDYRSGKWADAILSRQMPDGSWDLGQQAKDGICFPLSDDWRTVSRAGMGTNSVMKRFSAKDSDCK